MLSLLAVSTAVPAQSKPAAAQHTPSLLARARRILAIPTDQFTATSSVVEVEYPWLSDHELLHCGKRGRLFRYDLETKIELPLPALTRQVIRSPATERFLIASPGGKWVLWGESANNPFFVADTAGAHRFQWPGNEGMSEPYWCADGHHWIEVQFSGSGSSLSPKVEYTRALLHDANTPQVSLPLPTIPSGMQGLDILTVVSPNQIIARVPDAVTFAPAQKIPTVTKDGSFTMTATEMRTPQATQQISVWKLGQAAPLHRWAIHLPQLPSEVVVSPRGDRVAWLLSPMTPKTPPTALREQAVSLWVSRMDGRDMHLIGSVTKHSAPFNVQRLQQTLQSGATLNAATQRQLSALSLPMQVQWLPGGRAVSFQYQGTLWVVPVR